MNIWILDSKRGVTLIYKSFLDLPVKDDLVSGLLTALNQFTLTEFKEPIDSIDMGGFKWIYILDVDYNLLFVVADIKNTESETLKSRLEFLKNLFIKQFGEDLKNWTGDIELFKPFGDTIEKYYAHWQAAENVDLFADFFDMLGVFQQILNLLRGVIDNQIDFKKQENIIKNVVELFYNFKNRMDIKKIQELSKISYSKEAGFSIFNINPTNVDIQVVKKQIMYLLIQIIKIIKEELGHDLALNYFSDQNIFNYIFNNMPLLKKLKLEGFLLQLFLLK